MQFRLSWGSNRALPCRVRFADDAKLTIARLSGRPLIFPCDGGPVVLRLREFPPGVKVLDEFRVAGCGDYLAFDPDQVLRCEALEEEIALFLPQVGSSTQLIPGHRLP